MAGISSRRSHRGRAPRRFPFGSKDLQRGPAQALLQKEICDLSAACPQLYQPLSQEPEQGPGEAAGPGLQERLQMLGLHLPEPPADSEEEEEEEGAAAQSSRSSIPMDPEHVELVKRTMAGVKLPTLGIPPWASEISEEQWKDVVRRTLQARQSLSGPRPDWK